jgi:hypothetical protein
MMIVVNNLRIETPDEIRRRRSFSYLFDVYYAPRVMKFFQRVAAALFPRIGPGRLPAVPAADYRFVTSWRVAATPEEVSAILEDIPGLTRWWPSVYLEAEQLEAGGRDGIGRTVRLHTKGLLPYTLHWTLRVREARRPHGFTISAEGDLSGRGIWTLRPDGLWTSVVFDWTVRAEKPLLRWLSPLLRPLFAANHRWAMARGEESLRLELARRRAASAAERAAVASPPGPTTDSPWPLVAGGLVAGFAAFVLLRARSRRRRRRGSRFAR